MSQDTPADRAIARIRMQTEALDVAIDALVALRNAGGIDGDYANARIDQLDALQSDLRDEMRTIILTGSVAQGPGSQELQELRARIDALRNFNVSAASIQGMVDEAFAIAGAASVTRRSGTGRAGTVGGSVPAPMGFGAGLAAGVALAAAFGALAWQARR